MSNQYDPGQAPTAAFPAVPGPAQPRQEYVRLHESGTARPAADDHPADSRPLAGAGFAQPQPEQPDGSGPADTSSSLASGQRAAVPQLAPAQGQPDHANKWAQSAMHPEKVLFQIWSLLAIGIFIRVISPMFATNGIMIINGPAVLLVLVLPAVLAGTTVYYNKNLKDAGRAWLIGSAAVTTAFGIYLLAWAVS